MPFIRRSPAASWWATPSTWRASGSQGTISMMVGIDMDGAVTGVSIVTNSETSGIGSKVMGNETFWTNGTRRSGSVYRQVRR